MAQLKDMAHFITGKGSNRKEVDASTGGMVLKAKARKAEATRRPIRANPHKQHGQYQHVVRPTQMGKEAEEIMTEQNNRGAVSHTWK